MGVHPEFDRRFFRSAADFTTIGGGAPGGKASGLAFIRETLATRLSADRLAGMDVSIPRLAVLQTDLFDAFLRENDLAEIAFSDAPDSRIAHAFQKGSLPASIVGDLTALVEEVRQPLAVRSSSLLEDAMFRPFAGVYETKMIPNNALDAETRFRRLTEAVKLVYASTFFRDAKRYVRAASRDPREEKMAVIIQEVVGRRHENRFYPDVSGVGRSYNYYPTGHARPRDGVVDLALGLGKTIVDGGLSWSYSPAWPRAGRLSAGPRDLLRQTQTTFWAVHMGKPPAYDPIAETEYLVQAGLDAAEADGTLRHAASTYDPESDRIVPGTGRDGPRVLTFAPILDLEIFPVNDVIRGLLELSEEAVGAPVEIEFAITLPDEPGGRARFGFLQVRPLVLTDETVTVELGELADPGVLVASAAVLGNGTIREVSDVVYVKPEKFDPARTGAIAEEVDAVNGRLLEAGRPCVLIGFGRWGSVDPWLGIPVTWGQISAAKVIVEASLPGFEADPSQGSHFFHNLTSFRVAYFTVRHTAGRPIDWEWLAGQSAVSDSRHVRHVRLAAPLAIRVDGRTGRGVIRRGPGREGA